MNNQIDLSQTLKRLSEFAELIPPRKRIVIIPHDYPDPDALASAAAIGQAHGVTVAESLMRQGGVTLSALPGVDVQTRVWYNPNMISANYMVPALIGLILQTLTALLTALAIVREREHGTLEAEWLELSEAIEQLQ